MKRTLLLLVFFILLTGNLKAQGNYVVKGGINYSKFRNVVNSEPQLAYILGISKEWQLSKKMAIMGELLYSSKRGVLKNKKVHHYPGNVFLEDIYWSMGFIDVPVLAEYIYPLFKSTELFINIGPSLSIAIIDNSTKERKGTVCIKDFNEDNENKCRDYDYSYMEDPGPLWANTINSSGFGMNLGIGVKWARYTVEWRYYLAFHKIYTAGLVDLNEKFYTFNFLLGIYL